MTNDDFNRISGNVVDRLDYCSLNFPGVITRQDRIDIIRNVLKGEYFEELQKERRKVFFSPKRG
jgi:hypothetical protein